MKIPEYHPFKSAEAKERYLAVYDAKAKEWPVASETRMVDTAYGPTLVRISGPAGAPPLVLLPGGGGSSLSWSQQIGALSERHRTYAVDSIYDVGRSVYTREITSFDDFAGWLDELFSALNLDRGIDLMGLSYGGLLTAEYALRHPERLHKVVLLAPAAVVQPLSSMFVTRLMLCIIPYDRLLRDFYDWLFRDFIRKTGADRHTMDKMFEEEMLGARCFKAKRIVQPRVFEDGELGGLGVPALFLDGENDKIYSARKAVERLNRVAPRIKAEIIPDAGHDLLFAQKDLVIGKALEFLEK